MTRDEWCHLALHRTPIMVAMEGIPDAHATLVGWHPRRGCHIRFASGKTANVRAERVAFPVERTDVRSRMTPENVSAPATVGTAPERDQEIGPPDVI